MHADGDLARPEFIGGLFVGETANDKREHFTLPGVSRS
jgi:hypothetical protein